MTYIDLICEIANRPAHDELGKFLMDATAMHFHTPVEMVREDVRLERMRISCRRVHWSTTQWGKAYAYMDEDNH